MTECIPMKIEVFLMSLIALFVVSCEGPAEVSVTEEKNPGRDLVMESINAHGGTDAWYGNGPLEFRWIYHMTDRGPDAVVDTTQIVDPENMSAIHQVEGRDVSFGMRDGKAWIHPADAEFSPPPRFWALTPFYFIGIPFVFNDPNANFELLPEPIEFEGKDYTQVKITYDDAAGDTPEDYYVLLIDPESKLTRGAYYIVTSKLVAPDGPGPPKFITLDKLSDVGGVKLASGHRTFKMIDGKIGPQMRYSEVEGVKFLGDETVDFEKPDGAKDL